MPRSGTGTRIALLTSVGARSYGFDDRWDDARAVFFDGPTFVSYREREPHRILGHTLFVHDDPAR